MYEKKYWLFIGLFFPLVLIIIYLLFIQPTKPLPQIIKPTLDIIEIKAYEAFMERCRLLISLSLALIGAIGLLYIREKKKEIKTTNFQKAFIFISMISAGFSIYLGYITYCRIIEFLSNKMFNPEQMNPYLRIPKEGQFWTLLISVIFLGVFVFVDIINPKDKKLGETEK